MTYLSMTYFERSLYHRNRLNCLRHNEGKKCMRSKRSLYKRSSCTSLVRSCSHVAGTVGGGRGSKDGTVVRALNSHQCHSGSSPGVKVICGWSLGLTLVLAPTELSKRLIHGTPIFPSPQQSTLENPDSKCQFDLECTNTFKRVTGSS